MLRIVRSQDGWLHVGLVFARILGSDACTGPFRIEVEIELQQRPIYSILLRSVLKDLQSRELKFQLILSGNGGKADSVPKILQLKLFLCWFPSSCLDLLQPHLMTDHLDSTSVCPAITSISQHGFCPSRIDSIQHPEQFEQIISSELCNLEVE